MIKYFRTYQASVSFYRSLKTEHLPRHLRDQLERAASSICLNLAEGYGRSSPRDKHRFYNIAFGSLREVQSITDLADFSAETLAQLDSIAAQLYRLQQKLRP